MEEYNHKNDRELNSHEENNIKLLLIWEKTYFDQSDSSCMNHRNVRTTVLKKVNELVYLDSGMPRHVTEYDTEEGGLKKKREREKSLQRSRDLPPLFCPLAVR